MNERQFKKAARHLHTLAERWKDESEYEDFDDYKKSMIRALPKEATNVEMKPRPFEVSFDLPDRNRTTLRVVKEGVQELMIVPAKRRRKK